jgi:hypothetical protein
VVQYDNCDFQETVKEQILGDTIHMRNLTTAFAFSTPGLPTGGLQQYMFNDALPLDANKLIDDAAQARTRIGPGIAQFLLHSAIAAAHKTDIKAKFAQWKHECPGLPEAQEPAAPIIRKLELQKTKILPLPAMHLNAGKTDGTRQIIDEILLNKFRFRRDTDDAIFSSSLRLITGDQKTASLIRALKARSREHSWAYDRFEHVLSPASLFHVQMHVVSVIVDTHWHPGVNDDGVALNTPHCILVDVKVLQRR